MRLTIDDDKPKKPLPKPEKIIPFRELPFKKKLQHIWIYYKWHIMIPVFAVIASIAIGRTIYENTKDSLLYAVFLNSQFDDETGEEFMDDFIDFADLDMTRSKVTLDSSMYIYRNSTTGDTTSVASTQKLLAMFTSIEMDVIIGDKENFTYYASQGSFVTLDEVLPEDFLKQHADLLVNAEGSDKTVGCYGIDISSSKKLKEIGAYTDIDPIILAIPVTHMEDENILSFVKFLLEE